MVWSALLENHSGGKPWHYLGSLWVRGGGLNCLNMSVQEQEDLAQSEGLPCFVSFLEGYAPEYKQKGSSQK